MGIGYTHRLTRLTRPVWCISYTLRRNGSNVQFGALVWWQQSVRMRRCHLSQLSLLVPTFYRQVRAIQVAAKKIRHPPGLDSLSVAIAPPVALWISHKESILYGISWRSAAAGASQLQREHLAAISQERMEGRSCCYCVAAAGFSVLLS
jgi:hypothetical protein